MPLSISILKRNLTQTDNRLYNSQKAKVKARKSQFARFNKVSNMFLKKKELYHMR